jgi:hypothetical protein
MQFLSKKTHVCESESKSHSVSLAHIDFWDVCSLSQWTKDGLTLHHKNKQKPKQPEKIIKVRAEINETETKKLYKESTK